MVEQRRSGPGGHGDAETDPRVTVSVFEREEDVLRATVAARRGGLDIVDVFGPFAAYTVETFPARIRYTSVSVPYHIGNGWFGGFLPLIASAIVARTQNSFSWLVYPIAVLVMSVIVGSLFIDESFKNRIWNEVEQQQTSS